MFQFTSQLMSPTTLFRNIVVCYGINQDFVPGNKFWCLMCVGIYSLSVLDKETETDGPTVKHYRIRKLDTGGCFISPRKQFVNIPELVKYYKGKKSSPRYTDLFGV